MLCPGAVSILLDVPDKINLRKMEMEEYDALPSTPDRSRGLEENDDDALPLVVVTQTRDSQTAPNTPMQDNEDTNLAQSRLDTRRLAGESSIARRFALQSHGYQRMSLQSRMEPSPLDDPNWLDDPLPQEEGNQSAIRKRRRRVFRNKLTPLRELDGKPRVAFADEDEEEAEDLYEEEDMTTKQPLRTQNIRAEMTKLRLLWFDFKTWFRRQSDRTDSIPFLRSQIFTIEGLFGTGYASFFVFARTLFLINVVLALLWSSFVILPMALDIGNETVSSFHIQNLFTGKGPLEDVLVFYGGYRHAAGSYSMDLAYFLVILITYIGSLFFILNRVARAQSGGSAGSFVRDDQSYAYSRILLSSWDHGLTSKAAVDNLSSGLTNQIKDKISEALAEHKTKRLTRKQKIRLYLRRFLAWLLAIAIAVGTSTGIVFLVIESLKSGGSFVQTYGVPVGFTAINAIAPFLLEQLVRIENYATGDVEIYVTIVRTFTLRIVNIYALMVTMVLQINNDQSEIECGGTFVGQEFYKLVILDTLSQAFIQLVFRFGYYYWFHRSKVFQIPPAVLAIVYRQALIWVGMMFCPFLPFLGLLSNLFFFLIYYYIVKITCRPPEKRWSQSRNNSFFLGVLALTLCLLMYPMSVVLTSNLNFGGRPCPNDTDTVSSISGCPRNRSQVCCFTECGPFQTLPAANSIWMRVDNIRSLESRNVVEDYILSSTLSLPLIVVALAVIYYLSKRVRLEKFQKQLLLRELNKERETKKWHIRRCTCGSSRQYKERKEKESREAKKRYTIIYAIDVTEPK